MSLSNNNRKMRSILTLQKGRGVYAMCICHLQLTVNELETCCHIESNLSSLYFHMYVTNVFEETCEVIDIFVRISWRLLKRLFCLSKDFISYLFSALCQLPDKSGLCRYIHSFSTAQTYTYVTSRLRE